MSIAKIGELRFCSQWAFKQAPLLRIPLCILWAFLFFLMLNTCVTPDLGNVHTNFGVSTPFCFSS